MSNLKKVIDSGDLIAPETDCSDLVKNLTQDHLKTLYIKGEVMLSDGIGNALLVKLSQTSNTSISASIVKIPYSSKRCFE